LKTFFVPKGVKVEIVVQLEPEASSSKAKITSKPKNSNPKVMTNSDSKTSKIRILKRSKPVPHSLLKPESDVLKYKVHKNKTIDVSEESKPKGVKPKVMVNQKLPKPHLKVQEVKSKHFRNEPFEIFFEKHFCEKHGIVHEFSSPRTPQQNGVVERKNRTLHEMARTMIQENNLAKHF